MTDLEGACRRMAQAWMCDCEAGYCRSCQDAKAVIAAARLADTYEADRDRIAAALREVSSTSEARRKALAQVSEQRAAEWKRAEQAEADAMLAIAERDGWQARANRAEAKVWEITTKELGPALAERDALKADIERHVEIASREAEGRFQAEAKAEQLEAALRKYGEHYEGCHGGHRCHCGLSAALGEKP